MKKGRTRCPTSSFILFLRARLELARHNEEPVFITLEAIPRRGLGEAGHLRFRVFLAVLGVLHHIGESHQRRGGAATNDFNTIHLFLSFSSFVSSSPSVISSNSASSFGSSAAFRLSR